MTASTPRLLPSRIDLFDLIPPGSTGAELGVFAGDFTEEIAAKIDPTRIYAVDTWEGVHGAGDKDGQNQRQVDLPAMCRELQKRWQESPIEVLKVKDSAMWLWSLPPASLDWVYIDTTHQWLQTAHELAAARHAVKPGGWIMGHDMCSWRFPGVVRAVREAVRRWDVTDWHSTRDDRLASYALCNPPKPVLDLGRKAIVQLGIGGPDEEMLDFGGPSFKAWAAKHGWEYFELREGRVPPPRSPIWGKVKFELDLAAEGYDTLLTADADMFVSPRAMHVSPDEAFGQGGIGMGLTGVAAYNSHANYGLRAVNLRQPQVLPFLAEVWHGYHHISNHGWTEQAAGHHLQHHWDDVFYLIDPKWNWNFADRHFYGTHGDPVLWSYHGIPQRMERMRSEFAMLS